MQSINQVQWPGWNVVGLIGRGSFGAVYEIQRDVFGETEKAALKVITIPENGADIDDLRVEGYDDESITSRFQSYLEDIVKEYSTMAKMKGHPNVVYCDDVKYVQHDDGIGWDIYIKMELLTPIMKCLDQVENEQAVIDLGIAMCNALVLCKERSIVHRDIKPQNIFVSQDGTFKLGDFGIAKTAERTTSGTKVGTYKYMAPEVYNNKPYGPAADQYSLGLVMYWLLNDRRTPFSPKKATATEEDLARKRRFDGEQIPPPAHGSKQLHAIVLKACAYDPKQRFASAGEMLEALKALKSESSPVAAAVPMSGSAAESGAVVTSETADELTSGTVGRRRKDATEEGTISAFGAGAASAARQSQAQNTQAASQQNESNNRIQPAQQASRQYSAPDAPPQDKPEEKKKRGVGAWIAIAAGLVVVIGGVLLLTFGKGKDGENKSDTGIALNNNTSELTSTVTEPSETLPVQLNWAEWADELPNYVTDKDYEIEERTLYRSRNLETKSSTTSDPIDGWEYTGRHEDESWGDWSDWQEKAPEERENREIDYKTQYRSKSIISYETEYSDWSDWGDWSNTPASQSDTVDVKTRELYSYHGYGYRCTLCGVVWPEICIQIPGHVLRHHNDSDGADLCYRVYRGESGWDGSLYTISEYTNGYLVVDFQDLLLSENSLSVGDQYFPDPEKYPGYTIDSYNGSVIQYSTRTRTVQSNPVYSEWGDYQDTPIAESNTVKVTTRTVYHYRDLNTGTVYYFQRWTNWSDYTESPVDKSETVEVETKTQYRYKSKGSTKKLS